MSKADEFIREHTRNCSNLMQVPTLDDKGNIVPEAHPWLTPDEARKAVEIAIEETTEKIKRLLKENYLVKSAEPLRWVSWEKVFTDLKQAMKHE